MENLGLHAAQQTQFAVQQLSQNQILIKADNISKFSKMVDQSDGEPKIAKPTFEDVLNTLTSDTPDKAAHDEAKNTSDDAPLSDLEIRRQEKAHSKMLLAAQDLEAVFLAEMISPIFDQLNVDPVFGGGSGEKIFRNMIVQEYGKSVAQNGGVGIQDAIVKQINSYKEGVE